MNQSIRSTEEIEILFKKKNKLGNVRYRGRSQTTLTRRGRKVVQWNLDLRKPDLRKNLDLRKIVGTTDFLVHKLFDLRKIF